MAFIPIHPHIPPSLQCEQEAKQILADANQEAEAQIREGRKRFVRSSALSVVLLIVTAIASVYAVN
jgi:hypothetical protein